MTKSNQESQPATNQKLQAKGFASYVPVVATCMVLCGVPAAMMMSCGGIFYHVIAADLGVQTAQVTVYMSIMFLSAAALSPLMGRIMEKFDLRLVLTISVLIEAAVMFLFSQFTDVLQFWVAGVALGVCNTTLLSLSTPTIINRWFAKNVGLLVGICFAFTGVGGVIFIAVGQAVMDAYGWRAAYMAYAIIMLVVCLPFTTLVIRSYPAERGMLPYGADAHNGEGADANAAPAAATSVRPEVAMKSPAFWLCCACCGLIGMTIAIASFFPKYVDGLSANPGVMVLVTGAVLASIAMAGQAVGKVGLGFMGDLSVKKSIALACSTGILGTLFCWLGAQTVLLPVGGFVFGFFYAAAMVFSPLLVRSVFGSGKHYGITYSRIYVSVSLFSAIGQVIWPFLADNAGGFDTVFTVALVLILVIAALGLAANSYAGKLPQE